MRREDSSWYAAGFTKAWWKSLPVIERKAFLAELTDRECEQFLRDWRVWAHDYQIPPDESEPRGDWDTWLFLAGRGSGKTRSAVEYIIDAVNAGWARRIAIVGQGEDDVRTVMIEGESGFLECSPSWNKPTFYPSKGGGQLIWPNGCTAFIYSAEDTEGLRGPQFHLGWFDEPMAVSRAKRERALDNLEFCLRLGRHPQLILTTTPKKDPWLRAMERDAADPEKKIHLSRATTYDNADNLASNFLKKIERKYGGTRIGRQEIEGKILSDEEGALWTEDSIENCRKSKDGMVDYAKIDPVAFADHCARIVVGVDPNAKGNDGKAVKTAHSAGVVVAAALHGERFVLADRSVSGGPSKWGKAAVEAALEFDADEIVCEAQHGGEMVRIVLRQEMMIQEVDIPIHLNTTKKSKERRAEPVANLYDKGLVHHVGKSDDLETLETQMLYLHEELDPTGEHFDRADALVWALTRLGLKRKALESPAGGGAGGFGIMSMEAFGNA